MNWNFHPKMKVILSFKKILIICINLYNYWTYFIMIKIKACFIPLVWDDAFIKLPSVYHPLNWRIKHIAVI